MVTGGKFEVANHQTPPEELLTLATIKAKLAKIP